MAGPEAPFHIASARLCPLGGPAESDRQSIEDRDGDHDLFVNRGDEEIGKVPILLTHKGDGVGVRRQ